MWVEGTDALITGASAGGAVALVTALERLIRAARPGRSSDGFGAGDRELIQRMAGLLEVQTAILRRLAERAEG